MVYKISRSKFLFFAQKKEVQENFKTEEYFEALTPRIGIKLF